MLLDSFTLTAVRRAKDYAREVARYHWDFYAALSQQRTEKHQELKKSLLSAAEGPFTFEAWQRIVDYQYSLHPLSAAGSILTDPGGRFNIGDIDRTRFPPFAALYLAEDRTTAMLERFGPPNESAGLSNLDFALRDKASFTCVSVSGQLDAILDLRKPERLNAFVDVISEFKIPSDLVRRARDLEESLPTIVRSVRELSEIVLHPEWRALPMRVDVPAASQILGQLVWGAGIEGVLFPSAKGGATCLAVFPENLSPTSYVELDDRAPAGVVHTRMDSNTSRNFVR